MSQATFLRTLLGSKLLSGNAWVMACSTSKVVVHFVCLTLWVPDIGMHRYAFNLVLHITFLSVVSVCSCSVSGLLYIVRVICTALVPHLSQLVGCHLPTAEHVVVSKLCDAPLSYIFITHFRSLSLSALSFLSLKLLLETCCLVISLCLFVASSTN